MAQKFLKLLKSFLVDLEVLGSIEQFVIQKIVNKAHTVNSCMYELDLLGFCSILEKCIFISWKLAFHIFKEHS